MKLTPSYTRVAASADYTEANRLATELEEKYPDIFIALDVVDKFTLADAEKREKDAPFRGKITLGDFLAIARSHETEKLIAWAKGSTNTEAVKNLAQKLG